jgi:hypothetical protein
MLKQILLILCVPFITAGCADMHGLNASWHEDNAALLKKVGSREYEGVTKREAVQAASLAFQKMGIVVTSADYATGLLAGISTAPNPLSYSEFQTVVDAEDERARRYVPLFFTWDLSGFDSIYNVFVFETAMGVRVSLGAKLSYRGNPNRIPVSEFPPKAVEIALPKMWVAFEDVLRSGKRQVADAQPH